MTDVGRVLSGEESTHASTAAQWSAVRAHPHAQSVRWAGRPRETKDRERRSAGAFVAPVGAGPGARTTMTRARVSTYTTSLGRLKAGL